MQNVPVTEYESGFRDGQLFEQGKSKSDSEIEALTEKEYPVAGSHVLWRIHQREAFIKGFEARDKLVASKLSYIKDKFFKNYCCYVHSSTSKNPVFKVDKTPADVFDFFMKEFLLG